MDKDVSFSYFPLLDPGAPLWKLFCVSNGYTRQPDCLAGAIVYSVMEQSRLLHWAEWVKNLMGLDTQNTIMYQSSHTASQGLFEVGIQNKLLAYVASSFEIISQLWHLTVFCTSSPIHCHPWNPVLFQVKSTVQFSSLTNWVVPGGGGEHEGWFSRDPLPVFSAETLVSSSGVGRYIHSSL